MARVQRGGCGEGQANFHMSQRKLNIAIVGLGFGAEFIPIYQRHPNANMYAICQRDPKKLDAIGDAFGVDVRYTDYRQLLKDPKVDVVHINSPIPDHGWMSIAGLKAGKHVACTVPMATSIEDCRKIVELQKKTKLKYMMMETVVYAREFLYISELYRKGTLGKIQFLQASHQQDMDGWPNYWPGLPPMWYATHCVGPMLALTDATAEYVSCFGSGTVRKELIKHYGSPFAVETAHVKVSGFAGRPVPVQKPHPPFMIGGGSRRILTVAGREADIVMGRALLGCVSNETLDRFYATAADKCEDPAKAPTRMAAG